MFLSQSDLDILYDVLNEYTIQTSNSITIPPELEEYKFSERFEKRMQHLIARQRKSYYALIDTVAKRVAGYVIIFLVCALVTVFSVKSLREPFINFVVETYEKFTSIFVDKDTVDTSTADVEFEVMLPTYIPEGYEEIDSVVSKTGIMYKYKNISKGVLTYSQDYMDIWKSIIDTENTNYEKTYIKSLDGIYYQNKNVNCLMFGNDIYTFNISGYISKEELIKIAESINIQ